MHLLTSVVRLHFDRQIELVNFSADLLLKLKNFSDAELIYRELLERNPENAAYYEGLRASRQPSNDNL